MARTGGIGGAFAAVPAAATLIGNAIGRPEIGIFSVLGAGVTALVLRPKEGSLLASTMMAGLGFHGANSFGIAGALGATAFGGLLGAAVDYQAQVTNTAVF